MSLSARNGWLDKAGRVFIIYTVQEVQDSLGCADKKATKLLRELEEYGLIAVSYTHLDVYKRQNTASGSLPFATCSPPWSQLKNGT